MKINFNCGSEFSGKKTCVAASSPFDILKQILSSFEVLTDYFDKICLVGSYFKENRCKQACIIFD